jgi:transcriptional regulator with XRE-family HTH domain
VRFGELLRQVRVECGLSLREVEERSEVLAELWGNRSHIVSSSYLGKVENGRHDMTVSKLLALAQIYRKPVQAFLSDELGQKLPLPDSIGAPKTTRIIVEEGTTEDIERELLKMLETPELADQTELQLSEVMPRSKNRFRRAIIGNLDRALFPLVRAGAVMTIDTHRRTIVSPGEWTNEFDRPIYLLHTREGYFTGWCELDRVAQWLTLVPNVRSRGSLKRWQYGKDVEVIGRAVSITMGLL